MSVEDISQHFVDFQICKIDDNHLFSSIEAKGNFCHFFFSTTVRGFNTFGVTQLCKRMIPEGVTYEYSKIRFVLIKAIEEYSDDPNHI